MANHAGIIEDLVKKAMNYYRDFILPGKKYHTPDDDEINILTLLRNELAGYDGEDENELQSMPFNVVRKFDMPPKNFFSMFYEVVFGQERGPRFGTFVKLVGKEKALTLLDKACGI